MQILHKLVEEKKLRLS